MGGILPVQLLLVDRRSAACLKDCSRTIPGQRSRRIFAAGPIPDHVRFGRFAHAALRLFTAHQCSLPPAWCCLNCGNGALARSESQPWRPWGPGRTQHPLPSVAAGGKRRAALADGTTEPTCWSVPACKLLSAVPWELTECLLALRETSGQRDWLGQETGHNERSPSPICARSGGAWSRLTRYHLESCRAGLRTSALVTKLAEAVHTLRGWTSIAPRNARRANCPRGSWRHTAGPIVAVISRQWAVVSRDALPRQAPRHASFADGGLRGRA